MDLRVLAGSSFPTSIVGGASWAGNASRRARARRAKGRGPSSPTTHVLAAAELWHRLVCSTGQASCCGQRGKGGCPLHLILAPGDAERGRGPLVSLPCWHCWRRPAAASPWLNRCRHSPRNPSKPALARGADTQSRAPMVRHACEWSGELPPQRARIRFECIGVACWQGESVEWGRRPLAASARSGVPPPPPAAAAACRRRRLPTWHPLLWRLFSWVVWTWTGVTWRPPATYLAQAPSSLSAYGWRHACSVRLDVAHRPGAARASLQAMGALLWLAG